MLIMRWERGSPGIGRPSATHPLVAAARAGVARGPLVSSRGGLGNREEVMVALNGRGSSGHATLHAVGDREASSTANAVSSPEEDESPPPLRRQLRMTLRPKEFKVELSIEPGQSLGLMIRGGVEYNLGVFITGVDKDSVADRAGLMIGDQILEVNGRSFLDVTHDEAVSQLKIHKRMTLTVRDVGKVPHSCTDHTAMPHGNKMWESQGLLSGQLRTPALQMVEEKARVVLTKSEFATLAYYQEEYAAHQMTIEAFVAVLLELLSSPEKIQDGRVYSPAVPDDDKHVFVPETLTRGNPDKIALMHFE